MRKESKTFPAVVATNDHGALIQFESKLINAAHRKALEAHRQGSRPPVTVRTFAC